MHRIRCLSGCALALLLLAPAVQADPKGRKKAKKSSSAKAQKASAKNLKATIKFLSGLKPARNYKNLKSLNKAADRIKKTLTGYGFTVREQTYEVKGKTYRNLITNYGPEDKPLFVVGAHYDVCGNTPGADDNGSGVAALLELGRLLKTRKPKLPHRIELVAFTLEEPPFFRTRAMGSYQHAKSLADAKKKVRGMLSLETIGFYSDKPGSQEYPLPHLKKTYPDKGNFIGVIGDFKSSALVQTVKKRMKASGKLDVQSLIAPRSMRGVDFSDHLCYWAFGIPAAMVTDTAFFRTPHYHKRSDTMKHLDFKRMVLVVEGVYAALREQL